MNITALIAQYREKIYELDRLIDRPIGKVDRWRHRLDRAHFQGERYMLQKVVDELRRIGYR